MIRTAGFIDNECEDDINVQLLDWLYVLQFSNLADLKMERLFAAGGTTDAEYHSSTEALVKIYNSIEGKVDYTAKPYDHYDLRLISEPTRYWGYEIIYILQFPTVYVFDVHRDVHMKKEMEDDIRWGGACAATQREREDDYHKYTDFLKKGLSLLLEYKK